MTTTNITITNNNGIYTVRDMRRNLSPTANKTWYCKRILLKTRNEHEAIGAKMSATGELDVDALLNERKKH